MSLIQIGLVDKTKKIDPALLTAAAAALNVQVIQDLPKYWPITATVQYLSEPTHIPVGTWPLFLVASLPPGEGGFHMNKHKQPYAEVIASPESEEWTIDASHEIIEMLVDPYGNRMQTSQAIAIQGDDVVDAPGKFNYLVEAADPCEADSYTYSIQGIAVSDFITPHFYDAGQVTSTNYSFTGAIKRPRQVLPGGYISYVNLETNEWQQILWVDPNSPPTLKDLGTATGASSLRIWVDNQMQKHHLSNEARASADRGLHEQLRVERAYLAKLASAHASIYAR